MLGMRAATRERDAHVGYGRAREHAQMLALHGIGERQALPIEVKLVGRGHGAKLHTRACRQRFQAQVHLGIVAQRLKVSHALNRLGNRLFIENAARRKADRKAKAVGKQTLDHLQLHRSHKLQMDLLQMGIPTHAEHGVLVR